MLEFKLQNYDECQRWCVVSAEKKSKKELLIEKKKEIEEELKKIEARDNAEAKKLDTKRKFIVGEVALAYVSKNPEFAKLLREALKELVTKQRDLDAISDLISDSSKQPAIKEANDLTNDLSTTEETTVEDNPDRQSDSKI